MCEAAHRGLALDLRTRLSVFGFLFAGLAADIYAIHNSLDLALAGFVLWLWLLLIVIAQVGIESEKFKPRLITRLESPDYRTLYLWVMTPIARWPRDWRLYDWALRLAVLYPIALVVLIWVATGRAATIGAVAFLPTEDRLWPRLAAMCAIAVAASGQLLANWASASLKPAIRQVSGWLPLLAFILAVTAAVTAAFAAAPVGSAAGSFAGAVDVAYVVALISALPSAREVPVAFIIAATVGFPVSLAAEGAGELVGEAVLLLALAFAGVAAFIVQWLTDRRQAGLGFIAFTLLISLEIAAVLKFAPWHKIPPSLAADLLFIGLFPLINAVFDYASYAVTLTLIRWGLRANWGAAFLGLLDLGLAALLYTAAGATMILAIVAANRLAGVTLYPLAPLFAGIRADPMSYLWVYLMLFATVLPTVAHGVVATFRLSGLIPVRWRQTLTGWIGKDDAAVATAAPFLVGTLWLVSVLGPCLALFGLYLLAATFWEEPLLGYLSLFEHLARWLGEVPAQP